MFLGYIKNNEFNKSADWFYTGDIIDILDGRIILKGRADDEIKVAGNKVSLKYLENNVYSILSSLNLEFIVIVPIPHDFFGNILALVINKKTIAKSIIVNMLRKKLNSFEIPHIYFYIEDIPYTQTMKIDRKKIIDMIKNETLENLND